MLKVIVGVLYLASLEQRGRNHGGSKTRAGRPGCTWGWNPESSCSSTRSERCSGSVSPLCCSTTHRLGWVLGDFSQVGDNWKASHPITSLSFFSGTGGSASPGPISSSQRAGAGTAARGHCFAFQQNEQVINHAALFVSLVQEIF